MTEFYPKKQTPEQVDEGLRDAMKQAKEDGVFDLGELHIDNPYFSGNLVKYVCTCDFFGGGQFCIHFTEKNLIPNRWIRFWTRVFFNSKWEFLND